MSFKNPKAVVMWEIIFLIAIQAQIYWPVDARSEYSQKDVDVVLIDGELSVGGKAPNGWRLDQAAARQFGICSMYVVGNSTFDTSPAVIYARIGEPSYQGQEGIDALVQESAVRYRSVSKNFKLEKKTDHKSKQGLTFKVRHFLNGPRSNAFEAVGYALFKNRVVLVVYSAQKADDFLNYQKDFYAALDRVIPFSSNLNPLSGSCLYPRSK